MKFQDILLQHCYSFTINEIYRTLKQLRDAWAGIHTALLSLSDSNIGKIGKMND